MKRPKQLPSVDRKGSGAASSTSGKGGVYPATLVGQQPTPACRLLSEYGCS
jgi:hypothetical protein